MNTKLQAALKAAGLSQSELARRIGIDQSQVNRWVSRKLKPSFAQLARAMAVLEKSAPGLGYRLVKVDEVRDA